jgi:hypothetical protein
MPHFWHLRTTHCILHKGQEAVQVARMRTTRLPTTPFPLSVAVYVHEFDARRSSLVKSLDRFTWSTHKNAITHTKRGRVLVGMHESVYPARTERTARQSVAGMSLTASVTNFVSHFRGKCGAYFLIHIHMHHTHTHTHSLLRVEGAHHTRHVCLHFIQLLHLLMQALLPFGGQLGRGGRIRQR